MSLTAQAETISFLYETPRPGLADLGIRPGSLLFAGKSTGGNAYAGVVTTFSRQCGDTTFPVAGEATSDGARLIVYGQKPSRDRRCKVTGYKPETLLFELRQVR